MQGCDRPDTGHKPFPAPSQRRTDVCYAASPAKFGRSLQAIPSRGSATVAGVVAWRIDYNTERPHSSLKYKTPEEFAAERPFDITQRAQPLELKAKCHRLSRRHRWPSRADAVLVTTISDPLPQSTFRALKPPFGESEVEVGTKESPDCSRARVEDTRCGYRSSCPFRNRGCHHNRSGEGTGGV